jgi:hypothetical protein
MTTDKTATPRVIREYLAGADKPTGSVTVRERRLCHSKPLVLYSEDQQKQFEENGGFVGYLAGSA